MSPPEALEPLPEMGAGLLRPQVASRLKPLLSSLESDPRDAAAAGAAGMLLQAYEQHGLAVPFLRRARTLEPDELRWEYYLGVSLGKLGRHGAAGEAFRRCTEIDPSYLPARRRLGTSMQEARGPAASVDFYRELLRDAPDDPRVLLGAARAESAAGNPGAARDLLQEAVRTAPSFAAAHYALAMAYRELGMTAEAGRHLERYDRDPHAAPPDEDPLLQSMRALRVSAAEHLRRGAEAERAGRIEEAIELHGMALEEDPGLLQARVNLLILYGRQGQTAAAEDQYRLSLEAEAESAELHYNYGVIAFREGRADDARRAFQRALDLNPHHAPASHNLGQVLEEEGRFDEAMELYRRAVESRPDHGLSHYKIGMLWMRRRNAAEAVRAFREAAREQSDRTPTYVFSLGAALLASGERELALARLREAREGALRHGQADLVARIDRTLEAISADSSPRR